MILQLFYFIAAFILFYFNSPHICKNTLNREFVGGAYANFPG